MKHRKRVLAATGLAAVAALVVTALFVVPALATPPALVTTTTFGVGRFDNIDSTTKTNIPGGAGIHFWQARINTKGASDLYVLQNTIQPGGTFGWHSHPGPSLVIVKSGTATFYMADDPHLLAPGRSGRIGLRRQRPRHARRPKRGRRRPRDSRGLPCSGRVRKADRRAGAGQLPRASKRLSECWRVGVLAHPPAPLECEQLWPAQAEMAGDGRG